MRRGPVSQLAARVLLEKIEQLRAEAERALRERYPPERAFFHDRLFLADGRLSADGSLDVSNTVLAQLEGVLLYYRDG